MTTPAHMPLLTFITTNYAGITRGRSVAAASYEPGRKKSLGWVPANMSLTPFDLIADPNPWGSSGDLRLLRMIRPVIAVPSRDRQQNSTSS